MEKLQKSLLYSIIFINQLFYITIPGDKITLPYNNVPSKAVFQFNTIFTAGWPNSIEYSVLPAVSSALNFYYS